MIRPLNNGERIPWRESRYTSRTREEAVAWQARLRARLGELLRLDDEGARRIPFELRGLSSNTTMRSR